VESNSFRSLCFIKFFKNSLFLHASLVALSSRFYTLCPHVFGMRKPPVINTLEMVQKKVDLSQSLLFECFLKSVNCLRTVENGGGVG
jgi:hypothetical protein